MRKLRMRAFYKKNVDMVYRYIYFRVGQKAEIAEDLTSEVFIKALKHFDTYDPSRGEKAWILTITKNHLANYYRDRKVSEDIEDHVFHLEGSNGSELAVLQNDAEELQRALKTLSKEERRLVEMRYLEGYRYKEMAIETGKSAGAVRIKTHRALQKLKTILIPRYARTQETISSPTESVNAIEAI